ncbi:MAG: cadmium-translocating P-type ATPase, partial [Firmicutes bacterium]|nr:cadmium-translocating P-type ATPase [Bacillota bacterium]
APAGHLPFTGEAHDHHHENEGKPQHRNRAIRLIAGAIVYAVGMILGVFVHVETPVFLIILAAAYIIVGGDVVLRAVRNIAKGQVFDENFLMCVSSIGAFVIGEYPEAVAVMLFYQVGEFFQTLAVERSRRSIAQLMDIRPDSATVKRGHDWVVVDPETVSVGDILLVKPGEKVPLDGVILEGSSALDTRALTGESLPRNAAPGDMVLSGCINESGVLTIEVTKTFEASTAAKIIDLVENAASRKAPSENFITKFARYYTPVVVFSAIALAILPPILMSGGWADWVHRAFVFLVVSCPCALVISIPLTFFGGIGAASRKGILIKGGNYLEALNSVDTMVFDKTGTLTKGVFKVTESLPAEGLTDEEVLALAAQAEALSNHPIAKSILTAYGKNVDPEIIQYYEEVPGRGTRVTADGRRLLAGSEGLMKDSEIAYVPCEKPGTKVYLAADGHYMGCILIADEVKADSKKAIENLRALGMKKMVMFTGDEENIAREMAKDLGLDEYHAEMLPHEKVAMLERLDEKRSAGSKLAFVGDGINDAPVLARADVGIAMGGLGSDAAIEAADVVLMTDEPAKLTDALKIAKETKKIVIQNIVFALGVKFALLVLGALGIAGMWEAVFGDVGVMVIAVLNAMRILRK